MKLALWVLIDTVHMSILLEKMRQQPTDYIWLVIITTSATALGYASAVIDGGTLRFIAEPFKREQSN